MFDVNSGQCFSKILLFDLFTIGFDGFLDHWGDSRVLLEHELLFVTFYECINQVLSWHLGHLGRCLVCFLRIEQISHIVDGGIGRCGLALRCGGLLFFLGYRIEEVVDQRDGAVDGLFGCFRRALGELGLELIVRRLDHIEEHTAVGDIDGCPAQFLIEGGVVEQIQVLKHQQACRLEIGIEGAQGAQLVERVAIQVLGVLDQLCQLHRFCLYITS